MIGHALDPDRCVAVCAVDGELEHWYPTLRALQDIVRHVSVVMPAPRPAMIAMDGVVMESAPFEAVMDQLGQDANLDSVLLLVEPCVFDARAFDRAKQAMDDDPRIAVVCPIGNSSGYLSAPFRNQPTHHQIDDLDELAVHERLNSTPPDPLRIAPIPVAAGPIALLARHVLGIIGSRLGEVGHRRLWISDFSLRALRRGFLTVVDPAAFALRPWDLGLPSVDALDDLEQRHRLHDLHPFWSEVFDGERVARDSTVGIAVGAASARIRGLDVAIDGTCLGPKEMGTQVQTLALVRSLCERDDVNRVTVAVPGSPPLYAKAILDHAKITVVADSDGRFPADLEAHIVHRPFQPDRDLPFDAWSGTALRTVVTVQDVIAYQVGPYHPSAGSWASYRSYMRSSLYESDGVVVISGDTLRAARSEGLITDDSRTFVVENGTDHLSGDEPVVVPMAIEDRGWLAAPFLVVLGANYGHKNRDLAIGAWHTLRKMGHPHRLVMVGAAVPIGSSRAAESKTLASIGNDADGVLVLPDLTSEERNWVLRHADLVLYPTSAEGFGLVPFEAARFGTPCLSVGFGPLLEVAPDLPVRARSWLPADLASAAHELLSDPDLANRQRLSAIDAGMPYTWARTAQGLVTAYHTLLSLPPKRPSHLHTKIGSR